MEPKNQRTVELQTQGTQRAKEPKDQRTGELENCRSTEEGNQRTKEQENHGTNELENQGMREPVKQRTRELQNYPGNQRVVEPQNQGFSELENFGTTEAGRTCQQLSLCVLAFCDGDAHVITEWIGCVSTAGKATLRLLLIAGTNFSEFSGNQQNR